MIPPEEFLRKKARQSIVFFLHPESETIVQPLINLDEKSCENKDGEKKYKSVTAIEYLKSRFAATYQY